MRASQQGLCIPHCSTPYSFRHSPVQKSCFKSHASTECLTFPTPDRAHQTAESASKQVCCRIPAHVSKLFDVRRRALPLPQPLPWSLFLTNPCTFRSCSCISSPRQTHQQHPGPAAKGNTENISPATTSTHCCFFQWLGCSRPPLTS